MFGVCGVCLVFVCCLFGVCFVYVSCMFGVWVYGCMGVWVYGVWVVGVCWVLRCMSAECRFVWCRPTSGFCNSLCVSGLQKGRVG